MVTGPGPECDDVRTALGAYVLDVLGPDETRRVEEHLAACPDCARERDSLAAVVPVLGHLDADTALRGPEPVEPGPEMLERLLERAEGERRASRRWRVLASAAVVVLLLAGAGWAAGVVSGGSSPGPGPSAAPTASPGTSPETQPVGNVLETTDEATGVWARLAMRPGDWGTKLSLSLSGIPEGARCRLVAVGSDGKRETAASWHAGYEGTANVDGVVALEPEAIERFEVITFDGAHLVTVRE
ncbi:MAG: zf-HC2 domain-containing protein [Actinomycetes bacterium]